MYFGSDHVCILDGDKAATGRNSGSRITFLEITFKTIHINIFSRKSWSLGTNLRNQTPKHIISTRSTRSGTRQMPVGPEEGAVILVQVAVPLCSVVIPKLAVNTLLAQLFTVHR